MHTSDAASLLDRRVSLYINMYVVCTYKYLIYVRSKLTVVDRRR